MKCVTLSGSHDFNGRGICRRCGAEYLDPNVVDNHKNDAALQDVVDEAKKPQSADMARALLQKQPSN